MVDTVHAFQTLQGDRQIGMSAGAIPFVAMDRYAQRFGVRDFPRFMRRLQTMDRAYLEALRKKDEPAPMTADGFRFMTAGWGYRGKKR